MSLVNSNEFIGNDLKENNSTLLNMNYGAGGVFAVYIFNPDGSVRISLPVNILGGGISVNDNTDTEVESSGVFIFEPGISLGISVAESFTPTINISYRLAIASSLENLSNEDISGLSFGLTFKFG